MRIKKEIEDYFSKTKMPGGSFDIIRHRKQHRFFDQKCTPDVLSLISELIEAWIDENGEENGFRWKDLMGLPIFEEIITTVWDKPKPSDSGTKSEYDKFFQQPLLLLEYAGVLSLDKEKKWYEYKVKRPDIIKLLATGEREATGFVCLYVIRMNADNKSLGAAFDEFDTKVSTIKTGELTDKEKAQAEKAFEQLRNAFNKFWSDTTGSDPTKKKEAGRVFAKYYNVWALYNGKPAAIKGKMSHSIKASLAHVRYNQPGWYYEYLEAPSGLTRQEAEKHKKAIIAQRKASNSYTPSPSDLARAKREVAKFHKKTSEVDDNQKLFAESVQIHHMAMAAKHPDFADTRENLICLTPCQHLSRAHPNNNNNVICPDYLMICLHSKAMNIQAHQGFYDQDLFAQIAIRLLNEYPHLKYKQPPPEKSPISAWIAYFEPQARQHSQRYGYLK